MASIPVLDRAAAIPLETRQSGWLVMYGEISGGALGWAAKPGLLRVVMAEPFGQDAVLPSPSSVLERAALAERMDTAGAADFLVDAARTTPPVGDGMPGAGVTVIDLFPEGRAEVACRYSPSVLFAGRQHVSLLPLVPDQGGSGFPLQSGDRLIAYSASFLGALDPEILSNVPAIVRDHDSPAKIWRELVTSTNDSLTGSGTAAGLVIIARV